MSTLPPETPIPVLPLGKLGAALAQAQQRCRAVAHDSRNEYHRYNYTSAEAVIDEAKAALADCGLALLPIAGRLVGSLREGEGPRELLRRFLLIHSSGEFQQIEVSWPVLVEKGRPLDKGMASAATLSLAYLLRDLLLMPRVEKGTDVAAREEREASGGRQPPESMSGGRQPPESMSGGRQPPEPAAPVMPAQRRELPASDFIRNLNAADRKAARLGYLPSGGLVQWLTDQLFHQGLLPQRSRPSTWPEEVRTRAIALVRERHAQELEQGKGPCPEELRRQIEEALEVSDWGWVDCAAFLEVAEGTPPSACTLGQMRRVLVRLTRPELFREEVNHG